MPVVDDWKPNSIPIVNTMVVCRPRSCTVGRRWDRWVSLLCSTISALATASIETSWSWTLWSSCQMIMATLTYSNFITIMASSEDIWSEMISHEFPPKHRQKSSMEISPDLRLAGLDGQLHAALEDATQAFQPCRASDMSGQSSTGPGPRNFPKEWIENSWSVLPYAQLPRKIYRNISKYDVRELVA